MNSILTAFEDDVVTIKFEDTDIGLISHIDVHQWGPQKAKYIASVWKETMALLFEYNIPHVLALTKEEDTKLQKFAEMLGFLPEYEVSADGINFIVWSYNIEEIKWDSQQD